MATNLTISRAAEQAGVGLETIRFYERRGLIKQPPKPRSGGYRYYDGAVSLTSMSCLSSGPSQVLPVARSDLSSIPQLPDRAALRRIGDGHNLSSHFRMAVVDRLDAQLANREAAAGSPGGICTCRSRRA